jgi:hypothetical protein
MSARISVNLLSGRAQNRLFQLQRALTIELRKLNAHQSLLHGGLQACDIGTQASLMQEYLERVDAVLSVVMRLRSFVGRHSNPDFVPGSDDNFTETMNEVNDSGASV